MVGSAEARELQSGTPLGQPQRDHLAARVGDADDRVHELTRHGGAAFHLETQVDEERRGGFEVGDGDSYVIEALDLWHGLSTFLVRVARWVARVNPRQICGVRSTIGITRSVFCAYSSYSGKMRA